MDIVPFNSRDSYYKSKFGAVKSGEKIKFRIVISRSFNINGATLAMRRDSEADFTQYGMYWAGMYSDNSEIWDVEITAPEEDLYWYHFNLYSPWGLCTLYNDGNGKGIIDAERTEHLEWQLTVYSRNFETPDWIKGGIIYQIFPDRFYNSGKAKKNVPTDRILRSDVENLPFWRPNEEGKVLNNDYFGGDLKGIEKKLPYLEELGVTCIYLNPIFEAHSNHRYNTADYTKIDPLLGDEKDFVSLCKAAHKRGIKIILDGVFSHTGDDSVYFNKYCRYGNGGAYNDENSPYRKWFNFEEYPEKYRSWWGFETLPEVNEESEEYLEFMTGENGIVRKWLRLGADGWRLDVADELPDVFIDSVRKAVKAENPDAFMLGEVWEDATNKFSYGQRRRFLLGNQFDSVMNYPFANAVLDFTRYGVAEDFEKGIMTIVENYPAPAVNVLMNHIGTHDTERAITKIAGESCEFTEREWQEKHNILPKDKYEKGIRLMKLAASLQYMLPGVPSVYYGDEVGMQGYKDPFNRAYFTWDNINEELNSYYKKLGIIRESNECLKEGEIRFVSATLGCVAFERNGQKSALLIIANRNEEDIIYNLPTQWHCAKELTNNITVTQSIEVPKMSAVIIKRNY